MTHTYTLTGMTCNGCKNAVEMALLKLDTLTAVHINLETSEAVISMTKHVDLGTLQQALSEKYTISEKTEIPLFQAAPETKTAQLRQLFPLFLIFVYITIAAFLRNINPMDWASFMLDFMGLFYIVFSFFKLLDLKGFPESFKMYDPVAKAIPAYGWVYPFIELALGVMFLMRFEITFALMATLIILGITTIGVTKALLNKKAISCACLGTALKLPMTKATFIENSIMLIMAIAMLLNPF